MYGIWDKIKDDWYIGESGLLVFSQGLASESKEWQYMCYKTVAFPSNYEIRRVKIVEEGGSHE